MLTLAITLHERLHWLQQTVITVITSPWPPLSDPAPAATGSAPSALSSGKQHRRTTRETDKKRALAVALAYERAAKGKGHTQRVRQILSEFLRDHFSGEHELPFASVTAYFEQWLAARKAETSLGTHRRYKDAASKFLDFLGPQALRSIEDVTRAQIKRIP